MQTYMVGGAVRDKILGLTVHDRDFVVIGSTEDEMLHEGYQRVGKSFPVFLHPQTKEEYALARKEIKSGPKHGDFRFIFTPDITLKEDSIRRDFTCNAIYEDTITGEIIDYHNGREDIKNKILRHISEHFAEDPLRVLRACRFAAQLNFTIAPETIALCQQMVHNGALNHLSKDRIWQELEKALSTNHFEKFIENAKYCDALQVILPEVAQLFNVPERLDFHPEGNSGTHTLLAIKAAKTADPMINFATLLHDIGKIKTDPACWPSHRGHDTLGENIIRTLSKRLRVPVTYTDFAVFTAVNHMIYHCKIENELKKIAHIAIHLSRFANKDYEIRFISVLKADLYGRDKSVTKEEQTNFEKFEQYLHQLVKAASEKKISTIPEFEELVSGIKNGTTPPAALNEAYIKVLLEENPYLA